MSETLDRGKPTSLPEFQGNAIPPAVRRAAEEAERLLNENLERVRAANRGEPEAPAPQPPTTSHAPVVSETAPAPQPPAKPPEEKPVTQIAPPAAADYEQQFRTLKGKYDAELPAALARARTAEATVAQLQNDLQAAQRELANRAPPPAAKPAPVDLSADEEAYGPELVAATRRWARAEFSSELEGLRGEVTKLKGDTGQVQAQTLRDRTNAAITSMVKGDWLKINDDPRFVEWLQVPDVFSGRARHDLLREAYSAGQAPRVAEIFNAWIREQTAALGPPAAPPTPPNGAGRVDLADLAEPGRGRPAAGAGAPEAKRNWSQGQIVAFYRDVGRGMYRGKEAEQATIERDILAAASEGRVM